MENHEKVAHAYDFGRIGFSEEQGALSEVAAKFCADHSSIEKVRALMTSDHGYDQKCWEDLVALGWLGIAISEDHDGAGLSLAEVVPVMEQMGRRLMATPFVSTTLAGLALQWADDSQSQKSWLPKISTGTIATIALMEAEGKWENTSLSATIEKKGGSFELTANVVHLPWGQQALLIIVPAMYNGEVVFALVHADALSKAVQSQETSVDETRRCERFVADKLTLSAEDVLTGAHFKDVLMRVHRASLLLSTAERTGACQAVIDYTLDYLKTRKQFGKTIGSYQALKHPMVDIYTGYEQARSHLYGAAHCFSEQGKGEIATRMACVAIDRVVTHAADRSIQFHGGFGFTYDCDAQLYRRLAAWHSAVYGDGVFHRAQLGSLLLG